MWRRSQPQSERRSRTQSDSIGKATLKGAASLLPIMMSKDLIEYTDVTSCGLEQQTLSFRVSQIRGFRQLQHMLFPEGCHLLKFFTAQARKPIAPVQNSELRIQKARYSILHFALYNSNTVVYLGSMLKVWLREFQLKVVMKKL